MDLVGSLEGGDGEEGVVKEEVKDYKEAEVEEDHKEEGGRWTTRSPCCPVHGLQGDVWELPFQVGIFPVPSTSMVCNPEIAYGWA